MTAIANIPITTALNAQAQSVVQFRDGVPLNVVIQAVFTYGSGGTSAKAWIQTSFDGGATWCDVALFSVTTASATSIWNVSVQTVHTTAVTPTNGALATGVANDGVVGPIWRALVTTTGNYAGNTTLRIDIEAFGSRATAA